MPRLFLCIVAMLLFLYQPSVSLAVAYDESELSSGYITVVDETGATIFQTGLIIHPGDQFINEDNRLYEITEVKDNSANAHYIRDESLFSLDIEAVPAQAAADNPPAVPPNNPDPATPAAPAAPPAPVNPPKRIAIYHTHTDESYTPTDGKPTERGNGSIMLVGKAFADRLNELGYNSIHDKTLHDPHDANAYQRSRRTFMSLMKEQQPAALFDIHRDSAPLSIYKTTINGQDTARLLLVVGQKNQNRKTTMAYAKRLKSAADKKYKGLVRGIFIARGNYNQDINPRAMLVEVGTQYNTREAAERGITLFADIVPSLISPTGDGSPDQSLLEEDVAGNVGSVPNYISDILYMLVTLVIGTITYLYLSTGSWKEVKRRLNRFRKYEFTNFLAPRKKRKD